ncbi:MAG: hypothetical protein ACRD1J_02640 [Terriglobia bacterium]
MISADEKTSIQARSRKHPTRLCQPGRPMRIEQEYHRCGVWVYLAALDVHRARVFGRCEAKSGVAPFDRLVDQVMMRPPYDKARRVFSIVQRKVLTPNDFPDLAAVAERRLEFQSYYESIAKPFEWKFTRQDLVQLLSKMDSAAAWAEKYATELMKLPT